MPTSIVSFPAPAAPLRPDDENAALVAHTRRVTTLAHEIARHLALPRASLPALEQSARFHHAPRTPSRPSAVDRLLDDLNIATTRVRARGTDRERVIALWAFHGIVSREPDPVVRTMAEIVTLADLIDEQMEFALLEPKSMPAIWDGLCQLRGMFGPPVLEAAGKAFPGTAHTSCERAWNVPVQAMVAKDLLQTLTAREHDFDSLVKLGGRDPVLAGNLIKAANSALYGRTNPVRSLPEAVGFLGTDTTRDLLMALALRPVFASAGLVVVWKHSLTISRFCQGLAYATECMPPEEALLLGLMHDVGRVALHSQSRQFVDGHARLLEGGCPHAYIEQLLYGKGHNDIGAELLTSWLFPPSMIEAVASHHRPANVSSKGAAALYLAEFWSEDDEDLPSLRHLGSAFDQLGCSMEILEKTARFRGPLAALMAA